MARMDAAWNELNARRGLTARQSRMLDLEALVEGTFYDALPDWNDRTIKVPCCERKPVVQLGLEAQHVTKLVRALAGVRAWPTIRGADAIKDEIQQAQVRETLPLAVRDLVVKGSSALGFARLGDASNGPFEPAYLDVTWCVPLFVVHAGSAAARAVRDEMSDIGVPLPPPRYGTEFLWTPDGAAGHDLIFLRNEWVVDVEVPTSAGSTGTRTVRTRHRRDYLPHVIVDYLPVEVGEHDQVPRAWQVDGPVRPHGWGVVPIKWVRAPGAKPGEIDGPSFLRPEVRSLSRAADYTKSLANDSVRKIAWPQLGMIDAKDPRRDINAELNPDQPDELMSARSEEVIEVQSRSSGPGSHQAKLEILEIDGAGPKVAEEHIQTLKAEVTQHTGMVDFDQSMASGTLSGTALERMLAPYISTVEEWRVQVDALIVGVLRLIGHVAGKAVKPELVWPSVLAPTPADIAQVAASLATATGGAAVLSQETAAELLARYAGTIDAKAEVARLRADAETALDAARQRMQTK